MKEKRSTTYWTEIGHIEKLIKEGDISLLILYIVYLKYKKPDVDLSDVVQYVTEISDSWPNLHDFAEITYVADSEIKPIHQKLKEKLEEVKCELEKIILTIS